MIEYGVQNDNLFFKEGKLGAVLETIETVWLRCQVFLNQLNHVLENYEID